MKIRITHGRYASFWYSKHIGKVFEVSTKECPHKDHFYVIHEGTNDDYFVHIEDCEIVREEEPTPQLAGIHDSLASLAVEVTKLKSVINALTGQLTPLQLAILNAENTPADVKLTLIVEAGRLESERQAKLDA
jgi:hypothetical protein